MTSRAAPRVAAIDCGTNSIRLLVADIDPEAGTLVDVIRRMEIVRLGQDVDRTGRLAPEALARTFAALRDYRSVIDANGVERVRMVATSATRDASNREEFVAGTTEILGAPPEVATGDEEAGLSFAGATRELLAQGVPAPYLVVDIGGGSTEFVLGSAEVVAAKSVDIGCVRMTERHLRHDPPTPAEIAAARTDVEDGIDTAATVVPFDRVQTLVGVAGTVTTIAGIALDLPTYDSERIHLSHLSAGSVHDVSDRLLAMTREERAALPVMHPGRVDVIGAGALVLQSVVARLGLTELVVSEHDILDGIAWSTLAR